MTKPSESTKHSDLLRESSGTPCPYEPIICGVHFKCQKHYGHSGPHHWINEAPDFEKILRELDALRSALAEKERELHEFKESCHRRISHELDRQRQALQVKRVIARHDEYNEALIILQQTDDTIIVAGRGK